MSKIDLYGIDFIGPLKFGEQGVSLPHLQVLNLEVDEQTLLTLFFAIRDVPKDAYVNISVRAGVCDALDVDADHRRRDSWRKLYPFRFSRVLYRCSHVTFIEELNPTRFRLSIQMSFNINDTANLGDRILFEQCRPVGSHLDLAELQLTTQSRIALDGLPPFKEISVDAASVLDIVAQLTAATPVIPSTRPLQSIILENLDLSDSCDPDDLAAPPKPVKSYWRNYEVPNPCRLYRDVVNMLKVRDEIGHRVARLVLKRTEGEHGQYATAISTLEDLRRYVDEVVVKPPL